MAPKKKVVSKYIVTIHNAVHELRNCLDKISKPSRHSRNDCFELYVREVDITPTILALLVQVLNHPSPKARSAKELKWDLVSFVNCRFIRPQDSTHLTMEDQVSCSQEDIEVFASSLARGTMLLRISKCPDILECLLDTPQLEMNELLILCSSTSSLECVKLGGLVERFVPLKNLVLDLTMDSLQDPQWLVEGLANAFHLQSLTFFMPFGHSSPVLADVLVRDGGNSIIGQLLSPQSHLQELDIEKIQLEDRHFLQIVDVLPTSQLQVLNVSDNKIKCEGIFSFARQLPRIKSLNDVDLTENPWTNDHDLYGECITALLHGIMENHSIEELRVSYLEDRLQHFILATRARRIILETVDPIPVGLVPWILERVGTRKWNHEELYPAEDGGVIFQAYRASALYFVLQNSPILSSASLRRSRRKRKRVDRYH